MATRAERKTMTISLSEARARVVAELRGGRPAPRVEEAPLADAVGRILAEDVLADRDQPPFDRVIRDGYAVRAADVATVPARLPVRGEVPAGSSWAGRVAPGECVEIMTGAPLPAGADAVVMVEHTARDGDAVVIERSVPAGEHFVPAGSELVRGAVALPRGGRIDPAAVAMLATVGRARVPVYARPVVAVVPTGEELVEVDAAPTAAQIRNSNGWTLAAQVARAGGTPHRMRIARDEYGALRAEVEEALAAADLVVLTGGVSLGKYDLVEKVLEDLGAAFVFRAVAIRPGKPIVFGRVAGKPFFGLPGNPLSTLVTFELFARPAIELLGGAAGAPLRLPSARLGADLEQRPVPLTVFAPAAWAGDGLDAVVTPLPTRGSGDIAALVRAACFVVVPEGVARIAAGERVAILPR